MRSGIKNKPLLSCVISHSLPGRVRIQCRALNYLNSVSLDIEERLGNLPEVDSAKVSVITGNILVYFDVKFTVNAINING